MSFPPLKHDAHQTMSFAGRAESPGLTARYGLPGPSASPTHPNARAECRVANLRGAGIALPAQGGLLSQITAPWETGQDSIYSLCLEFSNGNALLLNHRVIESLRLEKSSKIMKSNRPRNPTMPAKPCPTHFLNTSRDGDSTLSVKKFFLTSNLHNFRPLKLNALPVARKPG